MTSSKNDAHLENDLNARLGPNSIPRLNTKAGRLPGRTVERALFRESERVVFYEPGQRLGCPWRRVSTEVCLEFRTVTISADFLLIDIYVTDPLCSASCDQRYYSFINFYLLKCLVQGEECWGNLSWNFFLSPFPSV